MRAICESCRRSLNTEPEILISGRPYCFFCAKREHPIALEQREEKRKSSQSQFHELMEDYRRRKSYAEDAQKAFDRECYPGLWRIINSPLFCLGLTVLMTLSALFAIFKLMEFFAPYFRESISGPLLILFGFAVLIGTMVTLPSLVVVVMNKLHAPLFELLKRREAEICKHRTKPKAFTEEPPKYWGDPPKIELVCSPVNNVISMRGVGYDRRAILERDGYRCQSCGEPHQSRFLEVHHVTPRANGGSDAITNLVTLCIKCHHLEDWFGHVHKERYSKLPFET
jgi:hypothetical protein